MAGDIDASQVGEFGRPDGAAGLPHESAPSRRASVYLASDDGPLLYVGNDEIPLAAVLDAASGEHLRNLREVGITGPTFGIPPMTDESIADAPGSNDSAEPTAR